MKLKIFQSDKGDCLLIESHNGDLVLADGGVAGSYKRFVRPALGKIAQDGKSLDLVYVSHIDQDHIAGVLQLMNDKLDWIVYDYQQSVGNMNYPRPKFSAPPDIKKIWHNSFHEQLEKNAGPIEDQLAAKAVLLSLLNNSWAKDLSEHSHNLVTSKSEAAKLSRRISTRQLNIPLNPEFNGKLMLAKKSTETIDIGSLSISVIGPFAEDLKKLRNEWNGWLKIQKGKKALKKIRDQSRKDEELIGVNEFDRIINAMIFQANELGNRDKVTTPNLASIMLLVKEDDKQILLTGDGHWSDILKGLKAIGKLDASEGFHVDVLKVQHHGSEHNVSVKFCRKITADHYIFCGNGAHHNPDIRIVKAFIDSRIGKKSKQNKNPQANNRFKLWFNSSSSVTKAGYKNHMRKIEKLLKKKYQDSKGQLKYQFLNTDSMDLDLNK